MCLFSLEIREPAGQLGHEIQNTIFKCNLESGLNVFIYICVFIQLNSSYAQMSFP